jgi:hypothetical protein
MPAKQLKKMGFVDVVENSLLYALHPRYLAVMFTYNFIALSLILYFVLRLITAFKAGFVTNNVSNELFAAFAVVFIYLMFAGIVISIVNLIFKGAFIGNAHSWFTGKRSNLKNDFAYSARRLPGMLLLYTILFIFSMVGYVFELTRVSFLRDVYMALLMIIFWFALPTLIIKKQGAIASLQNSWRTFREGYSDMIVYWVAGALINIVISTLFFAPLALLVMKLLFGTANILEISTQLDTFLSSPTALSSVFVELPDKIYASRVPLFLAYTLNVVGVSLTSLFWYAYTVAIFRKTAR